MEFFRHMLVYKTFTFAELTQLTCQWSRVKCRKVNIKDSDKH